MKAKGLNFANFSQINICKTQVSNKVKFIYSEKATKFCEIFHIRFDRYYIWQIYGGDFAKFCDLLRIYELYVRSTWNDF